MRARIVLAASHGTRNRDIARELGTREATVNKWRCRFHESGLKGLQDKSRSGKPPDYTLSTEKSILSTLDEPPPKGYATWTGPLVAEKLGISEHYVWRILRYLSGQTPELVYQYGPGVRPQSRAGFSFASYEKPAIAWNAPRDGSNYLSAEPDLASTTSTNATAHTGSPP